MTAGSRPEDTDPAAAARAGSSAWAVVRGARAAAAFLTRVPVGGHPYTEDDWRWAAAWFPLVGAAVGAVAAGVWRLTHSTGPLVSATCAVIASLLLTGALHEDGLADTADALGGAYDRPQLFAILKDSRIGSFGAAALTLSLVLRIALLARLEAAAPAALVLVGAWSRAIPVWLMVSLPYVTAAEASRSRPLVQAGALQAVVATLVAVAVAVAVAMTAAGRGFLGAGGAAGAAAVAVAVAAVCAWRFRERAGGITGDFLGAAQQITEASLLLWLALASARGW